MDESAPSPHPTTPKNHSLFTLSHEIRDAIYGYALTSSSPIIVWAGMPLASFQEWQNEAFPRDTPGHLNLPNYLSTGLPVEKTAFKLMLSHPIVAHEAALVFYSKNSFRFVGEWTWDEIAAWLRGIGESNRTTLTLLELSFRLPQRVWQNEDGTRTQIDPRVSMSRDNAMEQVYPRNRLLRLRENPGKGLAGVVENINPAIETCFQLLAGPKRGAKLVLSMLLRNWNTPGVQLFVDWQHPSGHWMSMDVPNVIEKCRELYTADGQRKIDVIWHCTAYGRVMSCQNGENGMYSGAKMIEFSRDGTPLELGRSLLEERGWEILDVYGSYSPDDQYLSSESTREDRFSMKRKPIEGDAIADDPSPHSWEAEWVD